MRLSCRSASLLFLTTPWLCAQTATLPERWTPVAVASAVYDNDHPVDGVVWRDFVAVQPGASWLRLTYTKNTKLDRGSYLRIVSLLDGDVQTMHQEHLEQWGYTSAYFNGNAVMVELVAAPKSVANQVEIRQVLVGDPTDIARTTETICGSTDDRVPSSHAAVGRIVGVGCTGWIVNSTGSGIDKPHLSAGHCFRTGQVLQFNVPSSAANCGLVHPPASRQFAIDHATSVQADGGPGNDYWAFRCFPNSTTGLTTWQTQGAAFTLATSLPWNGTLLRNYGFGLDGTSANNAPGSNNSCACNPAALTGQRNQTQQTHTGNQTWVWGDKLEHAIDTCGGNSGSVLLNNGTGQAVAVHTHGGCGAIFGANSGTAVTHAGLRAAVASVTALPIKGANECVGSMPLSTGANGPFTTTVATTSAPSWACGLGGNDIWFHYYMPCAGTVTFTTCDSRTNFDTTLQVFAGSCGALVSRGCNDDAACSFSALRSSLTVTSTGPTTFYVRVGGYNGARGRFGLQVSRTGC